MQIYDRAETRKTSENLFDWHDWPPSESSYPDSPGFKEFTTSRDAAIAIAAKAKTLRAKVLEFIAGEPDALTADQIAIRMQRSPFSIRPRISELSAAGLIERAEDRGKNEFGMSAARWRVANV